MEKVKELCLVMIVLESFETDWAFVFADEWGICVELAEMYTSWSSSFDDRSNSRSRSEYPRSSSIVVPDPNIWHMDKASQCLVRRRIQVVNLAYLSRANCICSRHRKVRGSICKTVCFPCLCRVLCQNLSISKQALDWVGQWEYPNSQVIHSNLVDVWSS